MITMLLGGLWHGAGWSFAVWGGLHGIFLIINHFWRKTSLSNFLANTKGVGGLLWKWAMILLTFNCVCMAWAFFRLSTFNSAVICLKKCLFFDSTRLLDGINDHISIWLLLLFYALISFIFSLCKKTFLNKQPASKPDSCFCKGLIIGLSITLITLSYALSHPLKKVFIYFQF